MHFLKIFLLVSAGFSHPNQVLNEQLSGLGVPTLYGFNEISKSLFREQKLRQNKVTPKTYDFFGKGTYTNAKTVSRFQLEVMARGQ